MFSVFPALRPGKNLTFLFLYHTIFLRPRTSKNRNPRPYFHTTPARNRHTWDETGVGRGVLPRRPRPEPTCKRMNRGWARRSSSLTPPGIGLQVYEPRVGAVEPSAKHENQPHFSAAAIPAWCPMHSPARRRSEIERNARKSFPLFKAKGGTNRLNICEISGTIVPHNRKVEYNHGR